MTFSLKRLKTIAVSVAGSYPGEAGEQPVKFKFKLKCHRLDQTEIDKVATNTDESFRDFLHRVVFDWEDVVGEAGEALPFNPETLDAVLAQPGMRLVCYTAYMSDIGARQA